MTVLPLQAQELSQKLSLAGSKAVADAWTECTSPLAGFFLHQRLCDIAGCQSPCYFDWQLELGGKRFIFAVLGEPAEAASKLAQRIQTLAADF